MNFKKLKSSISMPKTKNGKTIFWIVVIAIILFFGSFLYKFIKKLMGLAMAPFAEADSQAESTQEKEETINVQINDFDWSSLPHSKAFYESIADAQFSAMEYSGTDFTSLKNGVKDLTRSELEAVYLLYGVRKIATFGFTDGLGKTLTEAYADELTSWSMWGLSQVDEMQLIWDKTGRKI